LEAVSLNFGSTTSGFSTTFSVASLLSDNPIDLFLKNSSLKGGMAVEGLTGGDSESLTALSGLRGDIFLSGLSTLFVASMILLVQVYRTAENRKNFWTQNCRGQEDMQGQQYRYYNGTGMLYWFVTPLDISVNRSFTN
jgi:hypothetical protein